MNPGIDKSSFKTEISATIQFGESSNSLLELTPEPEESPSEKPTIVSILLADDCSVTRRGVRVLLETEPGWKVVAEASSGREAVNKAVDLRPDIVILSVRMRELNGLDVTRLILKAVPEARVLVLTSYQTNEMIERALHVGVHGYVLKSDAESDLMSGVRALLEQRMFFTGAASKVSMEYLRRGHYKNSGPVLTIREAEIVQLLAEGHSNKQVAGILNLSSRTVENHRAQIMYKLGLQSFSELIRYAVRIGMVEP